MAARWAAIFFFAARSFPSFRGGNLTILGENGILCGVFFHFGPICGLLQRPNGYHRGIMKERLQQLWPNIKFAWRHVRNSWRAFSGTDEVQALKRAFRVFWWRFGDVLALMGRLMWAWFLNTRMVRSARAWWQRTKKAVWELPQYQFLRRFFHNLKEHVWMRWLTVAVLALLLCLPWCVADTTAKTYTYLVVTDTAVTLVDGYPDFTYDSDTLRIRDDVGGDAQIILTGGQSVVIRHGDEVLTVESYTETVQNLLERYDITVGKDEMIGVNNTFGEVGKKEYLAEKFHLTVEDIVNKAKETIALKK